MWEEEEEDKKRVINHKYWLVSYHICGYRYWGVLFIPGCLGARIWIIIKSIAIVFLIDAIVADTTSTVFSCKIAIFVVVVVSRWWLAVCLSRRWECAGWVLHLWYLLLLLLLLPLIKSILLLTSVIQPVDIILLLLLLLAIYWKYVCAAVILLLLLRLNVWQWKILLVPHRKLLWWIWRCYWW